MLQEHSDVQYMPLGIVHTTAPTGTFGTKIQKQYNILENTYDVEPNNNINIMVDIWFSFQIY